MPRYTKALLRYLLFPFSILYGLIIKLRHCLYDWRIFSSYTPGVKFIATGNLSMGGTGKSPFTRWLAENLKNSRSIAILSRGYGRRSKGFRIVQANDTADLCGDEPLEFRSSLPDDIIVAVCEDRVKGIEQLLSLPHPPDLILLDDALQHRKLAGGFRILLTTFQKPYYRDFLFPTGYLRDLISMAGRCNALVFTKCPELSENEMSHCGSSSKFKGSIAFSRLKYPADFGQSIDIRATYLVIAGIARPEEFIKKVESLVKVAKILRFADHHIFSTAELESVARLCRTNNWPIITTQKDYMRLKSHADKELQGINVTFLPVSLEFMQGEPALLNQIRNYLRS